MNNPDPKRMAIASRLKTAREQAGLSQGQVAKILGLHRPSVSEIEAGRRSVAAEELVTLAKTYGVSVDWLTGVDTPDPERDRLELAARELSKLKKKDLDRLLQLLTSLRTGKGHDT
jgi:transcriptional regulator with XRE-family HTH domain